MKKKSNQNTSNEASSSHSLSNDSESHAPSPLEISHDWQNQMAMKNAAILKLIEELIDAELNEAREKT